MARKTPTRRQEATTGVTNDPDSRTVRLKKLGGSQSDHWNTSLANQAARPLWVTNSDAAERDRQRSITAAALVGIAPTDVLEGMMAAQLLAAHNAAMECYRRAVIGDQTVEGRREHLNQANKLPHLGDAARHPEQASWQGPAEGDGRACPCPRGRAGCGRYHRETGGWGSPPIGGTTPCKAKRPCPYPCTGAPAVEPGRGPGRRAGHPRWRTAGAGCPGAHPPVLRSVTPMPANTAAIVPRRSPSGGKSRHSSARYAAWCRRSTGRTEKRKRIGPLGFLLQFRVPL